MSTDGLADKFGDILEEKFPDCNLKPQLMKYISNEEYNESSDWIDDINDGSFQAFSDLSSDFAIHVTTYLRDIVNSTELTPILDIIERKTDNYSPNTDKIDRNLINKWFNQFEFKAKSDEIYKLDNELKTFDFDERILKNDEINPIYKLIVPSLRIAKPFGIYFIDCYSRSIINNIISSKKLSRKLNKSMAHDNVPYFVNKVIKYKCKNIGKYKKELTKILYNYFARNFKPLNVVHNRGSTLIDDNINDFMEYTSQMNSFINVKLTIKRHITTQLDVLILPRIVLKSNNNKTSFSIKNVEDILKEITKIETQLNEKHFKMYKRKKGESIHKFFKRTVYKYSFDNLSRYIIVIDRRFVRKMTEYIKQKRFIYLNKGKFHEKLYTNDKMYIINIKNNKYRRFFKINEYCVNNHLNETYTYNTLNYVLPSKDQSNIIDSRNALFGYNFLLSYHISSSKKSPKYKRIYHYYNGQYYRFFKKDIIDIWKPYFFIKQSLDKNIYATIEDLLEPDFNIFNKILTNYSLNI